MSHDAPAIEFRKVSKWFGDFRVLTDIDLKIGKGEKVVVCGPSGSGKSTLVRCINQLERHQQGEILLGGTTVAGNAVHTRGIRRRVGMVFQQFNLYPHMTALENCCVAQRLVAGRGRKEAEDIARTYLERVRIADKAGSYPHQLSGGQQQRVAIARALCMQSEVILFDEPTSALDPEMIREVLEVMVTLAGDGLTMVCVTHEMGFARQVADTVVFMDHGRIVEEAHPSDFFRQQKTHRAREFLAQILH
ncbi:putative ABC transporter ATP-binding subunit YhdZ [Hyphomicrobiales bacterium]|nr:putative ABC transporter ATP-binding subunit YhdZ [Hyphomicrobiales bacterium]CAH1691193.1 putative ABC transporter ATP-binding subunit YhdZ [Hyphomicrobiales bacterium]